MKGPLGLIVFFILTLSQNCWAQMEKSNPLFWGKTLYDTSKVEELSGSVLNVNDRVSRVYYVVLLVEIQTNLSHLPTETVD